MINPTEVKSEKKVNTAGFAIPVTMKLYDVFWLKSSLFEGKASVEGMRNIFQLSM